MSIASWASRDWGSADEGRDPDLNRSAYQQPDPVARRMGSVSIKIRTGAKQSAASRVVSSSTPIVVLSHNCRSATTVNYASAGRPVADQKWTVPSPEYGDPSRARFVVRITVRDGRTWWTLFEFFFRALVRQQLGLAAPTPRSARGRAGTLVTGVTGELDNDVVEVVVGSEQASSQSEGYATPEPPQPANDVDSGKIGYLRPIEVATNGCRSGPRVPDFRRCPILTERAGPIGFLVNGKDGVATETNIDVGWWAVFDNRVVSVRSSDPAVDGLSAMSVRAAGGTHADQRGWCSSAATRALAHSTIMSM